MLHGCVLFSWLSAEASRGVPAITFQTYFRQGTRVLTRLRTLGFPDLQFMFFIMTNTSQVSGSKTLRISLLSDKVNRLTAIINEFCGEFISVLSKIMCSDDAYFNGNLERIRNCYQ